MPSVDEATTHGGQLDAALSAGIKQIAREQSVTFTKYVQKVLPADGYVFWINTGETTKVQGSLHYAADLRMEEDETTSINRIDFTCQEEVQEFNAIAPGMLWIGDLGTQAPQDNVQAPGIGDLDVFPVKIAFSSRDRYFRKADVFHYIGTAVQAPLIAQLVDSEADLPSSPVVSNSLPIFLGLDAFGPVYPSFVVPSNVEPPYVVVHIPPESTTALQAFAAFDPYPLVVDQGQVDAPPPTGTMPVNAGIFRPPGTSPVGQLQSWQLVKERVRFTMYGFDNQRAIQFQQYLFDWSVNTDQFGVMNEMPVIRDEKRTQADILALAMKKTMEFDVSYYQATADAVARRLILKACEQLTVGVL